MVENPLLSLGLPEFTQEAQTHTGRTHAKLSSSPGEEGWAECPPQEGWVDMGAVVLLPGGVR